MHHGPESDDVVVLGAANPAEEGNALLAKAVSDLLELEGRPSSALGCGRARRT